MQVETLLRKVHPIKGFVYEKAYRGGDRRSPCLLVRVRPRTGSKAVCSVCGSSGPGYDHGTEREFQFVPAWNIPVRLVYRMRRLSCPRCQAVHTERVPWADGKSPLCLVFMAFLAVLAKKMSWKDVGSLFGASWDSVYRSVAWVVAWGKEHRSLDGITAIGVDEIARSKGQNYLTLVYQIDQGAKRLLWIGRDRTKETFNGFFDWLGTQRCASIQFVCSDMWRPYLDVIAQRIPKALNILDRFHLVAKLGFAVDQIRRQEIARLRQKGLDAILAKTRWIWLKKPRNLKRKQRERRDSLLNMNLRTVRAYLLRLDFEHVWTFKLPTRAGAFLDHWCRQVMRSRLEPLKQVAKSFRKHRELILNYFKARKAFSSGVVEGLNNKAKLGIRRGYGIKGDDVLDTVLFHQLGALPEPQFAHRFVG
jgi:transposase